MWVGRIPPGFLLFAVHFARYCLMSVAGCYIDFHIDFGGTSVWYHVLRGEKQFMLIPPSRDSYSTFQHWQMGGEQESAFLADLIGNAQLVHLHAGDTFIMPSGKLRQRISWLSTILGTVEPL